MLAEFGKMLELIIWWRVNRHLYLEKTKYRGISLIELTTVVFYVRYYLPSVKRANLLFSSPP